MLPTLPPAAGCIRRDENRESGDGAIGRVIQRSLRRHEDRTARRNAGRTRSGVEVHEQARALGGLASCLQAATRERDVRSRRNTEGADLVRSAGEEPGLGVIRHTDDVLVKVATDGSKRDSDRIAAVRPGYTGLDHIPNFPGTREALLEPHVQVRRLFKCTTATRGCRVTAEALLELHSAGRVGMQARLDECHSCLRIVHRDTAGLTADGNEFSNLAGNQRGARRPTGSHSRERW